MLKSTSVTVRQVHDKETSGRISHHLVEGNGRERCLLSTLHFPDEDHMEMQKFADRGERTQCTSSSVHCLAEMCTSMMRGFGGRVGGVARSSGGTWMTQFVLPVRHQPIYLGELKRLPETTRAAHNHSIARGVKVNRSALRSGCRERAHRVTSTCH